MRLLRILALLSACLAAPAPAPACNIPVFRYALERWRSERDEDRYQVVVFHRGPLAGADRQVVDTLRAASEGRDALANFTTETVDLAGPVAEPWQKLWQAQEAPELPWAVLRYPEGDEGRKVAWAGPLRSDVLRTPADSPVRREVARRLMQGDSIVWVLLESGDRGRDEAAAARLQAELKKLEKSIRLPDPAADDSVKLLSALPLTLTFSTVRLARSDPAEKLFVEMLLHTDRDLPQSTEPMVFPVFGRGRVLDALVGPGINADTIGDAARFLCGACSCLVKRLNPGVDLLMTADWDALLEDRDAAESQAPPPAGRRVPLPNPRGHSAGPEGTDAPGDAPKEFRPLPYLVLLSGVLVAVTVTLVWLSRSRKPEGRT